MTATVELTSSDVAALNGPVRSYPAEQTTLDLIDRQVRITPNALAVVYGEETLTYQELDTKANHLATILLSQGANPGTLLPLLITDGLELPLTIVAAMKAAIPFVPFDPSWPEDRTETLLGTLGTDLVVTSPRTEYTSTSARRPICVDAHELVPKASRPDVARPSRPDVFYGFFTSGTTGAPKCTLNHHFGLLNRFLTMTRLFGEGHVSLQNSRSTFDSSLWQLLWPLTSGGRVVMPVRSGLLDLEQTLRQIGQHGVTITDFVPSIFALLADIVRADSNLAECASGLRRILLGGEAINAEAVRRFHEILPQVVFTNTYGPTEASIGSVFHTFRVPPDADAEIPIGLPIDNTSAVVVDDTLHPVQPGGTGELLIGGVCVGTGYLADPDRTAASFIVNPFPDVLGQYLYRTGDLVQYRDDGLLYFIGRRDDQIKLRGVRIEPTEVENALMSLPGINDAKVVVVGDLDRAQLIAVVISDEPLFAGLREEARSVLPSELVPDRFVRLDRFPMSANGKTDRQALAAGLRVATPLPAARDALCGNEARIARFWADILPVSIESVDVSFFDLGGTSLSAQRLALALGTEFGRHVTIHDIATQPTIRAQAALVISDADGPGNDAREIFLDAVLDEWRERRPASSEGPRHVLLTGATGFIGIHLIEALLLETKATITCLVRAKDQHTAEQRLRSRLSYYRLPDLLANGRVSVEVGDLEAPRLGLGEQRHSLLVGSVDSIVHAGAQINLITPYAQLRGPNVTSTRTLIEFARSGQRKAVHYLSSLSVLTSGASVDEGSCLTEKALPSDGYSQTKWVAESLLIQARRQGLAVNVYRLGEVMPHTGTGVPSHTRSLTEILLETCRSLGVVTNTGAVSDFSPVDAVATFLASAVADSTASRSAGDCYHVVGERDVFLDDLLSQLRSIDQLDLVGYEDFRTRIHSEASAIDAPDAVSKLAVILPTAPLDALAPLGDLFFTSTATTFRDRFASRCRELNVDWPAIDSATLRVWCGGTTASTKSKQTASIVRATAPN